MERRDNGHYYGASAQEIEELLRGYSAANGYEASRFSTPVCGCGHRAFRLEVDDEEGVAVRTCASCGLSHPIGDSGEYLEDAEVEECGCPCGGEDLELQVGVALYAGSADVRWVYIGGRCPSCGLLGCFADWKSESGDAAAYLVRV